MEMRCQAGSQPGAEPVHMRHVEEKVAIPPALDKGAQLIFDIVGLLSGEPRDRQISTIALSRQPVAILAVFRLGLHLAARMGGGIGAVGPSACGKNRSQDCRLYGKS